MLFTIRPYRELADGPGYTPDIAGGAQASRCRLPVGQPDGAERLAKAILDVNPDYFDALHLIAVIQSRRRRHAEALASYDRALAVRPDHPHALYNRGNTLRELKRFDEALASYDRAIAVWPDYPEAFSNRGSTLQELKRFEEALASYDRALALRPNFPEALNNRGSVLKQLKRFEGALASYDRALALRPDHADTLNNRGSALHELKRFDEALASYDRALALRPDHLDTLYNRGITLHELKRFDEALASYDRALALRPDQPKTLNNRGITLQELKRFEEALASYDRALTVQSDNADALNNRGIALRELKRFDEALASFNRALTVQPNHPLAFAGIADSALKICDWKRTAELDRELRTHVVDRKSIIPPFLSLGYCSDPSLQLKCARSFVDDKVPITPRPLWNGTIRRHDRVRIAYLSADFRRHAMSYLITELFEVHDRTRFEVIGVSFGADDKSDTRLRVIKSFDRFHDVRPKADHEVARLLNVLEIDIAVDLMGYTQDSRPEILAYRPAPIQVNYLGFPGTMGTNFIDYVIADPIVLPLDQQPFLYGADRPSARLLPGQRFKETHIYRRPDAAGKRTAGRGLCILLFQQQL